MQKYIGKCRKIEKNVEIYRKMQKNVENVEIYRKMQINVEI